MKKKVRASSLINAIFVCLLVSVLCGSLVLLSSYQKILSEKLSIKSMLVTNNISAFNYFLASIDRMPYNEFQKAEEINGVTTSEGLKKKWGGYEVLISKTYHKRDTITQIALIGKISEELKTTALYLTNYGRALKISGNTILKGDISVPDGVVEQTFINGNTNRGVLLEGQRLKSNKNLPKIRDVLYDLNDIDYEEINVSDFLKEKVIVQSFDKKTLLIRLDDITELASITIKGNVIVESLNDIQIASNVTLSDIIIKAPKVVFKSGFVGNVQVMAETEIVLEEQSKLIYPSSLIAISDNDSINVTMKKESLMIGNIVVTGGNITDTYKRNITIEKDSKLIGTLFCNGYSELQGKVYGSVFTDWLKLKTKTSTYDNVLFDTEINVDSLPKGMAGIPLFEFNQKNYNAVIKRL